MKAPGFPTQMGEEPGGFFAYIGVGGRQRYGSRDAGENTG